MPRWGLGVDPRPLVLGMEGGTLLRNGCLSWSPAFHKCGELPVPLDALNRCIMEREDHKGEQFRLYHSVAALSSKLWASALLQLLL